MSFSVNQQELFLSIKLEKLNSFLNEWQFSELSEEEEYVFCFYELSNRRDTSEEVLVQLIDYLTGKENNWQALLTAMFLHYTAYFLWRNKNQILEAQNDLIRAISILQDKNNHLHTRYRGRIYDTLGVIKKSESLLKEAAYMFKLAIESKKAGSDLQGLAITYGNLGRLNMALGNFEESIKYLQLDIDLMEEHFSDNKFVLAQLLSTFAWAHLEHGDYDIAIENYQLSKVINEKLNNVTGLFYNEIGFAEIALYQKEEAIAKTLLFQAKEYLVSSDFFKPAFKSSKAQYSLVNSQYWSAIGNNEQAEKELSSLLEDADVLNQIQLAKVYSALAKIQIGEQRIDNLKKALNILDKTEHFAFREEIENELQVASRADYLLHAAGRFAGKEQMEYLINQAGSDGFQGHETEMAVLFSDIRGFTTLSEKLSPQDLITTLNRFFTLMTRVIVEYGGYVDKFIGDAIMAVFSIDANVSKEEKCQNAVMAAMHMRSELQRFKLTLGEGLENLDVGVGIHYGQMVSGLIGSPQKRSFTVIGDTVNTASRLEGLTKQLGGTLVVSEEVIQNLSEPEKFIIRPMGSYRPKGKKNPIKLYDIPALEGNDYWSQNLKSEALHLTNYHELNSSNKQKEAEEAILKLKENRIDNYEAGYQLLHQELQKYQSQEDYLKWDKVINLFSK